MPSSSAGPSKKQRREEQNDFAIGGMRSPAVSVSKLHQVRQVGEMIHTAWMEFVTDNPKAFEAAIHYGSPQAKLDEQVLGRWRERLESLLEVQEDEGLTLKEAVEFSSPLRASLASGTRGV